MKHLFLTIMLLYATTLTAQQDSTRNKSLKLYVNTIYKPFSDVYVPPNSYRAKVLTTAYDYVQPSLAMMWQNKRGNYHEAELGMVSVGERYIMSQVLRDRTYYPRVDYRLNFIQAAVRYEYIIALNKRHNARWIPSLGLAAMPFFSRYEKAPYLAMYVPVTTTEVGMKHFVVPRLQVVLSKRVFLDFNIPFHLFDFSTQWQDIENPTLPQHAQEYRISNLRIFPGNNVVRLGLGVKI